MSKKPRKPHRRDEEWKRLLFYARAMNVNVKIDNSASPKHAADWTVDGREITVYRAAHKTKTQMILSLIHELGHHLWFVHEKNRQPDLKFEEALQHESRRNEEEKPIPKKLRQKIYNIEHQSSLWWETIYKDTHMKFPIWKMNSQRELDVWMYEVYYKTGYLPSKKEVRIKKEKLLTKYRDTENG